MTTTTTTNNTSTDLHTEKALDQVIDALRSLSAALGAAPTEEEVLEVLDGVQDLSAALRGLSAATTLFVARKTSLTTNLALLRAEGKDRIENAEYRVLDALLALSLDVDKPKVQEAVREIAKQAATGVATPQSIAETWRSIRGGSRRQAEEIAETIWSFLKDAALV
jgi:hypothetical protein